MYSIYPKNTTMNYVGRKRILEKLTQRVQQGSQSTVIIGLRRTGKTSLLKKIYSEKLGLSDPSLHFIFLDAKNYSLGDKNTFRLWEEILLHIREETIDSSLLDIDSIDPFQKLLKLGSKEIKRFILLLDNLDVYLKVATEYDLRKIRTITDSTIKSQILLIATSSENPHSVIQKNDKLTLNESPFYNFHIAYLHPFNFNDTQSYIEHVSSDFSQTEKRFIYKMSGGHPELLNIVIEHLLNTKKREQQELNKNNFSRIEKELFINDQVTGICKVLFEQLAPSQKNILSIVANNGNTLVDQNTPAFLKLQNHHGFIQKDNKKITVFSELFKHYITENETETLPNTYEPKHATQLRPLQTDADIDQNNKDEFYIKKNEVSIKGNKYKLTNLESRLLTYLLKNKNRICTKNELLNNVWTSDKTDKVVERGINRLRQRIEEDASAPQYLLTIRGRGYKLIIN